jgi:hypothetical protein
MEFNPLRRVLTAKAATFAGLAMLVAVVMLVIASIDTVGQAGAAQKKPKPQPKSQYGAKQVINDTGVQGRGGVPSLTGTYKSKGGKLILYASGSGFREQAGAPKIGMSIYVKGVQRGQAWTWTNEELSHKAFVPNAIVVNNVPKGTVPIKLDGAGFPDTKTDENDNFKVTVLEIPK